MMFSEEVAWVTGSSTGIGAATAVALAEAGCRVAVHYNRSEVEAREVVERISSSGGEAMLVGATWPMRARSRGWRVRSRSATGASTSW
jgi:NAD(P)-dependent dehydrogenase (short-subunit alcohol dehydrogenase family)